MKHSHEVDYKVFGDDLQFVEIELDPQETVVAEAGAMMYMEDGISFDAKMGDGSNPKSGFFGALGSMAKRAITGESLFMTHFTNNGQGKKHVAFGAPYPGKIVAVDLDDTGGELLCQKNAFLCAALGTEITISFQKKFGAGLFGGEGFILQKLRGDGNIFIHAGGMVVEKQLNGEKLMVDTGCIAAFESSIQYDIQRVGGLKSMALGGEGLFFATLQGTGRVWLQSLPFSRLADRVLANAPSVGGESTGEGSVIKGLTGLLQS
ncbi:MAG TPA: TIGR00266 family protein [Chloroflexi bacterium]|nr:MAG: TIGR00266 family protein [Anaerolineaceae bacterium 4572_5.1]HEY84636.1 TIGR00266 family protein [Chloroflexota bacterium]